MKETVYVCHYTEKQTSNNQALKVGCSVLQKIQRLEHPAIRKNGIIILSV